MQKSDNFFVAPNGKLFKEIKVFSKCCSEIIGVSITELWRDAYERNVEKSTEVLFSADFCCPFPVVDHIEKCDSFMNGGGFRLDLDYDLYPVLDKNKI